MDTLMNFTRLIEYNELIIIVPIHMSFDLDQIFVYIV